MPFKLHFLAFVFLVQASFSQNIDFRIVRDCNKPVMPQWDKVMKGVSFSVYPVMPATVLGITAQGFYNKDKEMIRNGYKSALTIGIASAISTGIKYAVKRPRPFVEYPEAIEQRDEVGPLSFPSGHTTVAFASATALSLTYKKWYVAVPAYAYAGLVGYSRMRLGVHYPSDVLGGMIIGIGSGFLVWQLDKVFFGKKSGNAVQ